MLNTRGPNQRRCLLLASVVKSQILYAAQIWSNATQCPEYFRGVNSTCRLCALQIRSAFRTVSGEEAFVIVSMIPVDILPRESTVLVSTPRTLTQLDRRPAREVSITEWQTKWNSTTKVRCTYRCIPNLESWLNRTHGEVHFYRSQFLSDLGCFKAYLFKFKHEHDPYCDFCRSAVQKDVHHEFFECARFQRQMNQLKLAVGGVFTPQSVVGYMVKEASEWASTSDTLTSILKQPKDLERQRRITRD
ncbi:uncharacterized protein LOC118743795 [Rhagoletis pomonella]|uniref:uncharacterized protein LOC118743795 n=1 Tax=Rhagoletis pomonella TaxID=28610 RepID=UPI00177CDA39|nr:uncharacterized protein LOC118743795 [Rhagoletis pomonella]